MPSSGRSSCFWPKSNGRKQKLRRRLVRKENETARPVDLIGCLPERRKITPDLKTTIATNKSRVNLLSISTKHTSQMWS